MSSPDCSSVAHDKSNPTSQSYFHVLLFSDVTQTYGDISGGGSVSNLALFLARRLGVVKYSFGHSE